jgi:hypothetical protein
MTGQQAVNRLATGTGVILRGLAWAGEWQETLGRWILAAIAGSLALTGAALHPWLWPVLALLWMGGANAAAGPDREEDDEQQEQGDAEIDQGATESLDSDILIEVVHDVARGNNVHLAAIRARLLEETHRDWDVLRAAGIPTKPVRVAGADPAVTTGIHRTDLPPLSPAHGATHGDVVSAGHHDNNNSNNTPTVEQIGQAGLIVKHAPSIRQEARR